MSNITDSKKVMQAKDMQLVSTGQKIGKVLSKTGTYAFLLTCRLIMVTTRMIPNRISAAALAVPWELEPRES